MAEYYDENGVLIEGALSKEEVDARIAEQSKALQDQIVAEKLAAEKLKADLEAKVKEAQDELEKARANAGDGNKDKDKDANFAELRKKLKETEEALEQKKTDDEKRWKELHDEKVTATIKAYVGNNEELEKKVRYNFDVVLSGVKAVTPEEFAAKMASAYKLSTDTPPANPLDIARGGNSRGAGNAGGAGNGPTKPFTETEIAIGNMLGITDADRKKYGSML